MKFLICLALLFTSCSRPKGFTLHKITSRTPTSTLITEHPDWVIALFDRPLTYLGSGNHTYAFTTADNAYVVKFFKQNQFGPYSWIDYLPLPDKLNPKRVHRKQKRLAYRKATFDSVRIAHNALSKQTGVVYLHLNRTRGINRCAQLIDNDGKTHRCNIDKMEFIVQKRAKIGFDAITTLLDANQKDSALDHLISYLTLIKERCQKGIADKDLQLFKNFGFIDNAPIEIDVGDFKENPSIAEHWREDVESTAYEIRNFLQTHAEDLLGAFEEKLKEILQ